MNNSILIIIPARGGSKGIPRKNLRPLKNKPLLSYSINTALNSKFKPTVYVSSEDDEILFTAKKFGAKTVKRKVNISKDNITLDPVIYDAYKRICEIEKKDFEIVITLQPTSPLLKIKSLDSAIKKIVDDPSIDTIISGINDTHLSWLKKNGEYIPNYEERLNRQQLPQVFRETGGFLITRSKNVGEDNRIGNKVCIYELNSKEAIDIDSYEDWSLCEYYLSRKRILFVVDGYHEIGLGHIYNSLSIAHEILDHETSFLVGKNSLLGLKKIEDSNYPVRIQLYENILDDINEINPDIIINDRLDNCAEYIQALKANNYKVINFEDLGNGAKYADLVINAIYPEKEILPNHYFGHKYFVLRDEFLFNRQKNIRQNPSKVLITFGGVDPNNLTQKVVEIIYSYCIQNNIQIDILLGKGYTQFKTLKPFKEIKIHRNVSNISDFMLDADLIFTSAGRTTFEVASLGTPAIVLAQNERELTHFFASEVFGFINLGLGRLVESSNLLNHFMKVMNDFSMRKHINQTMIGYDLRNSKKRVIRLIYKLINEDN